MMDQQHFTLRLFFVIKRLVEALIDAGVDKTIKNTRGRTAFESVSSPFEEEKEIYDSLSEMFKLVGSELDYDHIKSTRPLIAELLK